MIYTNLHREILKVYMEDIPSAANTAAQTISDTRQANAQQASQYSNVSELLSSKESFVAQCDDIFKNNNNFDTLTRELTTYLKYDNSREFITAIAGGLNTDLIAKQFDKVAGTYLNNPQLLQKILTMVTDDIVKMPDSAKNKWTMAAQHLKDSLTKAIDTSGPKNPAVQQQQTTTPQPSTNGTGSGTIKNAAEEK